MTTSSEKSIAAARIAIDSGRIAEAEALLREVLAADARSIEALKLLALIAANTGRDELGLQLLGKALRADPDCFEALLWLGSSMRSKGRIAEALEFAERAVRAHPMQIQGHVALATCHQDLGDWPSAKGSLDRAIELAPADAGLRLFRARVLRQFGQFDQAISDYDRAIELAPTNVEAHIRLGELKIDLGDRIGAIKSFGRAYEIEPNTERGQIHHAKALMEQGLEVAAEKVARDMAASFPKSAYAQIFLGKMLQGYGRFEEAKAIYLACLAKEPGRAELYYDVAYCGRMTDGDRAMVQSMTSMLTQPALSIEDRTNLCYALGKSYNDLGEYESAFRHFDEANALMLRRLPHGQIDRERVASGVDSTIATYTREFFEAYRGPRSASELPILIVGMIRSGTSLMEQIVSSHPQVQGAGELSFWQMNGPGATDPSDFEASPDGALALMSGYQKLLEGIGNDCPRVTDKMPLNFAHLGLIHLLFPNARIVHCRRNPKDTCLSIYMTPYRLPVDFGHDKETITFFYEQYQRLMSHWRSVLPADRFIEVDYESIVDDRESATRRLVEFCGLGWDDSCLRHEENSRLVSTPSLWQVRQPVYRSSLDRWRRYEKWLGPFERLA